MAKGNKMRPLNGRKNLCWFLFALFFFMSCTGTKGYNFNSSTIKQTQKTLEVPIFLQIWGLCLRQIATNMPMAARPVAKAIRAET